MGGAGKKSANKEKEGETESHHAWGGGWRGGAREAEAQEESAGGYADGGVIDLRISDELGRDLWFYSWL